MTEPTTPIRKSSLPCTPPPEWEFHTWFPHPDGGGDMVPGERQRGVLVSRRVSYGDWEPVRPDRWADEPPTDASSAGVVQLPPTNQTALRDRITEALEHGPVRCPLSPCPVVMHTPDGARAHLANAHPGPVLPAPVDRATVLREEAALIRAHCPDHLDDNSAEGSWMNCHCDVADDMERRAAAEATPQPSGLSDGARIGNTLIWSWSDIGKGEFGEGYRAAQAEARALLTGQRGDSDAHQPEPAVEVAHTKETP
jgi:hypothetical protein